MTTTNTKATTIIKETTNDGRMEDKDPEMPPPEAAPQDPSPSRDNNNTDDQSNENYCSCCPLYCQWAPCFPHGAGRTLLCIIIMLGALFLEMPATDYCDFVHTRNHSVGINVYEDRKQDYECISWRDGGTTHDVYRDDDLWKAVRWFAGIASVLGVVAWLALLPTMCFALGSLFWHAVTCLMVMFFFALTFMAFGTHVCVDDDDCEMGQGAIFMLVTCVVWVLLGSLLLHVLPAPVEPAEACQVLPSRQRQFVLYWIMALCLAMTAGMINAIVIAQRHD